MTDPQIQDKYRETNRQYQAQLEAARQEPHPAVQYENLRSAALNWRVLVDTLRRNGGWELPDGITGNQLAGQILYLTEPDGPLIKVTTIVETCGACPSAWEGKTEDGFPVGIRFRWGELDVCVDDQIVFSFTHDNPMRGVMSYVELKEVVKAGTNGRITLPESCGVG